MEEKYTIDLRELDALLEKFNVKNIEDLERRLNYFENGKHDIESYERTIKNYKSSLKENTKAVCQLVRRNAWSTNDVAETGEPWSYSITESTLVDIEKRMIKGL